MKITKYEHACLVVEDQGKKLIIDPGVYSASLPVAPYDYVVVTHVHADHLDVEKLKRLQVANQNLKIFAVAQAANELNEKGVQAKSVADGDLIDEAGFKLEFFGGLHATIHPNWPKFENVGVKVNGRFYYPGDSFTMAKQPIDVLAVPASGPWMKIQEAMDFIMTLKAQKCIPTHDAILSDIGHQVDYSWLKQACEKSGSEFVELAPKAFLEL